MFSGIVESIGTIMHLENTGACLKISIKPQVHLDDSKIGDSLSVNGVCLTITECLGTEIKAIVVPETLRLTNLGKLSVGSLVNLERSIKNGGRNSGHYVQGHVDGMGEIIEIRPDGPKALLLKCTVPSHLSKYLVNKGYIAFDGMSLTIIEAKNDYFTLTLIPHTQQVTIAKQYKIGDFVNLEVDILGKYVEKIMGYKQHANVH
jgi:riboflavin synthase